MRTRVPRAGALSMSTLPPIPRTSSATIERPSRSAAVARARRVHAIEALEYAGQMLLWNARPVVGDQDLHAAVARASADPHVGAQNRDEPARSLGVGLAS